MTRQKAGVQTDASVLVVVGMLESPVVRFTAVTSQSADATFTLTLAWLRVARRLHRTQPVTPTPVCTQHPPAITLHICYNTGGVPGQGGPGAHSPPPGNDQTDLWDFLPYICNSLSRTKKRLRAHNLAAVSGNYKFRLGGAGISIEHSQQLDKKVLK